MSAKIIENIRVEAVDGYTLLQICISTLPIAVTLVGADDESGDYPVAAYTVTLFVTVGGRLVPAAAAAYAIHAKVSDARQDEQWTV